MSTLLVKKAVGFVAAVSLVACPILSSVAGKTPTQSSINTSLPVGYRQGEHPMLARNTIRKPDIASTESSAKTRKVQDKKAIGRCWQRLMHMAREVRHAQHNKK